MASYHTFYGESAAELNAGYKDGFVGYRLPASVFSTTTDPRSANQIKAVSDKINTGIKNIEVTGISTQVLESIPKQHFEEMRRLKELTGVGLTLHGPLVEATGAGQGRWDPQQRIFAERQMINAVERAGKMGSNTIVTFHSSNGLPEPETRVKIKDPETGKMKEVVSAITVVNERTGEIGQWPRRGANYWEGEQTYNPKDDLKKLAQENWAGKISQLNLEIQRARQFSSDLLEAEKIGSSKEKKQIAELKEPLLKAYKLSTEDPKKYQQFLSVLPNKEEIDKLVSNLSYSQSFARDAYQNLQSAFNEMYDYAQRKKDKPMLEKLNEFKGEIKPRANEFGKDPTKLNDFNEALNTGARLLGSIGKDNPPPVYEPVKEFALEKASETFANVALAGYKEFKKDAPIISIENPPTGMGITRADDLRQLVEKSQDKFIEKAQSELKMSKTDAEKYAKQLLGVTWDVGHINMIKKYGFDNADVLKETEKIAPLVKHIHLSDNFGLDHTELPMGMGNVPTAEHEKILAEQFGEKFKQITQVIETGNWYEPFKKTPLAETFSAFGSPLYPMKMAPYWNNAWGSSGNYFAGFGRTLPDIHFQTYGAGFSSLPQELGGEMPGRSRVSGNPME